MLEAIRQQVTHIRVRSPLTYRNLSVFPLQYEADSQLHYLTLAEALLHGKGAFAVGSRVIGLDIFDRAATCEKLSTKVLAGYALEAVSEHLDKAFRVPTPAAVKRLLADLNSGEIQSYPALGAGTDLRFAGRDSVGGGLFVDGALVHLAAFPAKRASMGPGRTAADRARRYGSSGSSRAA